MAKYNFQFCLSYKQNLTWLTIPSLTAFVQVTKTFSRLMSYLTDCSLLVSFGNPLLSTLLMLEWPRAHFLVPSFLPLYTHFLTDINKCYGSKYYLYIYQEFQLCISIPDFTPKLFDNFTGESKRHSKLNMQNWTSHLPYKLSQLVATLTFQMLRLKTLKEFLTPFFGISLPTWKQILLSLLCKIYPDPNISNHFYHPSIQSNLC